MSAVTFTRHETLGAPSLMGGAEVRPERLFK